MKEKEQMNLNRMIPKAGAAIVTVTVLLFAVFEIINFSMGSFFVCLILPIGFIMMTAGLHNEGESDRKVAANIGMVFAAVYCVFIMLVYFTQLTTVKNEQLNEQAARLLDFSRFGLIANYDLLGYGIMALSTFFTGLSNVLKDAVGRDRYRRKARLGCVVCIFPACRSSGIQALRRSTQKILTCTDIVGFELSFQ